MKLASIIAWLERQGAWLDAHPFLAGFGAGIAFSAAVAFVASAFN
jgi:hypothetical protein